MYFFRGRGVFIDVYKNDDKIATSGATLLADINLGRTYIYRAIDSVATGRTPSLFCANTLALKIKLEAAWSCCSMMARYPLLMVQELWLEVTTTYRNSFSILSKPFFFI